MPVFIFFSSRNSMSPSCHVLFTLLFFHRPQRDMSSPLVPPHYLNTLFFTQFLVFIIHLPAASHWFILHALLGAPGAKRLPQKFEWQDLLVVKLGLFFLSEIKRRKLGSLKVLNVLRFFDLCRPEQVFIFSTSRLNRFLPWTLVNSCNSSPAHYHRVVFRVN